MSAVDPSDRACSQCNTRLPARIAQSGGGSGKFSLPAAVGMIVLVGTIAAGGWWFFQERGSANGTANSEGANRGAANAETTIDGGNTSGGDTNPGGGANQSTAVAPQPGDSSTRGPSTEIGDPAGAWALRATPDPALGIDPSPVPALLIRAPHDRTVYVVPAAAFPIEGTLTDPTGRVVPTEVLTLDETRGFAVLITDAAPARDANSPLELAPAAAIRDIGSGRDVQLTSSDAPSRKVRVTQQPDGSWNCDRSTQLGAALTTPDGQLAAIALGGTRAAPLDTIHRWLPRRIGEPIETVQSRLRDSDPDWLLREVDRILANQQAAASELKMAVASADRAASLSRDRASLDAAIERQRLARLLLARKMARHDPAAATQTARDTLARFPDHHAMAGILVQLLAAHGNPLEAADVFVGLRATSPDHASGAARDVLLEGLTALAKRQERANPATAERALRRAIELFPRQAGLHMALARLLSARGDRIGAANQAREAAALDSSFAQEARDLASTPTAGEVVIRFTPGSNSIDTTVSVAGANVGYVVDTGASLTTLPIAVADRLGIRSPSNRKIRLNTASGEAEGELAKVAWVQIGSIRVPDVEVVVIDLPSALGGRGLLGMNVLGRLDMRLDGQAGRLVLKAK